MSASAKMMRSDCAASIPARTAAPLPACGTTSTRSVVPASGFGVVSGAGADEIGRVVGAPVVDDEHLDPIGQRRGTGRPVATDRVAVFEVSEQLVEGRADPLRLVEGGEHDRQALRRCHLAGSLVVARSRRNTTDGEQR